MPIYDKSNLTCNFSCNYCYEHPFRPKPEEIDYDVVEGAIRDLHQKLYKGEPNTKNAARVGLHGGEPLFRDKKDVERLLKMIYELDGRSSIQTNGYLIDDDIIEMFKKYKTSVGLSIDGPWPCNELRGTGSKKERKTQTNKILKTMNRLQEEGIGVSVIAVIHKKNASKNRRELLKMWVLDLHRRKITGRLNPCCCGKDSIDLTPEEAVDFYTDMYDFMLENGIRGWSPFRDIINSLKGESSVVCVYKECDPFSTASCYPVFKDGGVGVCLRLYSDGKTYLRSDEKSTIRSDVLRQTDCKDCRWWDNCHGGCTGLSIDFDWRNKDRYCLLYKALFEKTVNAFKVFDVKKTQKSTPSKSVMSKMGGHSDGYEHLDGDERHVDSDANFVWEDDPRKGGGNHQDGIEHIDGDMRHLDGG